MGIIKICVKTEVQKYKKIGQAIVNCFKYRVSHETWQLMNSLECHLPNTGLDFLQFSSVEKSFTPIYLNLGSILL